ncbi:MAG: Glycine cleavage system transcriptional repressor [Acidimicrobiales bacterium]|nr:Glycine cleavage system transcriptional repressor [Acidimicrobiales bacterium]
MSHHVSVTAIGTDQPGVVAALSGVLAGRGCNLEDTEMTILRGHFAMVLVVATPPGLDPVGLEVELREAVSPLGIDVVVRSFDDEVPDAYPGSAWTLAVHGADRPGIVHRVSRLLGDHRVNIDDLTTRVIGSEEEPVYTMVLDLTFPEDLDPAYVEDALSRLAVDLGVDCVLQAVDEDIL